MKENVELEMIGLSRKELYRYLITSCYRVGHVTSNYKSRDVLHQRAERAGKRIIHLYLLP